MTPSIDSCNNILLFITNVCNCLVNGLPLEKKYKHLEYSV